MERKLKPERFDGAKRGIKMGINLLFFLRRFAMRKEVLCRRSIFLEINMVILGLGFLILFLVSLVRRRVLILRIGSRRLLLRMNGVVMVFLLDGLVRGLFLLLILVWIWLLLRKKLNRTEQSLPLTERRCATQTRFTKTSNQDMAGACRPPRPEIKNLRYRYL